MNNMLIIGDWIHAHERDHGRSKVFVAASEPLPPSRGRQRLLLRLDGSFSEAQPGEDDRTIQTSGTYRFDGAELVLQRSGDSPPAIYEAVTGQSGTSLELKVR